LGFFDYFASECGLSRQTEKLEGLWLVAKNAGWFLPCENICFVSERHNVVLRDDVGNLHSETGAALEYPDGFKIYAWHGIRVPPRVITRPETITIDEIQNEPNAEIRRVMIERMGMNRYVVEANLKPSQTDRFGTLYSSQLPDGERYFAVHVTCPSTARDYFLRLPPDANFTTAHEAVAWTWGLSATEYNPILES
jgi:hypothetical protein